MFEQNNTKGKAGAIRWHKAIGTHKSQPVASMEGAGDSFFFFRTFKTLIERRRLFLRCFSKID